MLVRKRNVTNEMGILLNLVVFYRFFLSFNGINSKGAITETYKKIKDRGKFEKFKEKRKEISKASGQCCKRPVEDIPRSACRKNRQGVKKTLTETKRAKITNCTC